MRSLLPLLGEAVAPTIAGALIVGAWLLVGSRTSLSAEEAARAAQTARGVFEGADGPHGFLLALVMAVGGSSEAALRALSLLGTLLAVVGTWGTARHLLPPLAAGLAPLLLATSPLVNGLAAEASPYALAMGLLALLAWLCLPRLAQRNTTRELGTMALIALAVLVFGGGRASIDAGIPPEPLFPFWGGPALVVAAVALVGLLLPPAIDWRRRAGVVLIPVGLAAAGIAAGWLDPRAAATALPFVAIALAAGIELLGRGIATAAREIAGAEGQLPGPQVATAAVAVIALAGVSLTAYARSSLERSNYRGATTQVLQQARAGDLVVLGGPGIRDVVEHYTQRRVPVLELPFGPSFLDATADAMLSSLTSVSRQLWVVSPRPASTDGDVEQWLARSFYPIGSYSHGGARLDVYSTEPDMRTGSGRTVFGNLVELPEVALPSGTVARDFPIPVRLSWRARERVPTRLLVALELVDGNRLIARHETEPANGTRPTSTWEPGETVVDRIAIPITDAVSTGSYTVRIALVDASSRARWRLADGRDTQDLGMVRIGPATRPPL